MTGSPLVAMSAEGLSILSPEISREYDRKTISPSLVSALVDDKACVARWLADTFVAKRLVDPPVDTDASRGQMFHSVMEEFFALPPGERTNDSMNRVFRQVIESDKYRELGAITDARQWLINAIRGYFDMGSSPDRVKVAEIDLGRGNVPGLEVFLRAQLGDTSRKTLGFVDRISVDPRDKVSLVVEDYKGLALDTPIPTPDGWTTMEDLKVGDTILGSKAPTKVMVMSEVHTGRPCYRVSTYDGGSLVADNVHLWEVYVERAGSMVVNTDKLVSLLDDWERVFIRLPEPYDPRIEDNDTDLAFHYGVYLGLLNSIGMGRYVTKHGARSESYALVEAAERKFGGTIDNIFKIPLNVRRSILAGLLSVSLNNKDPRGIICTFIESSHNTGKVSSILLDLLYLEGLKPVEVWHSESKQGDITEVFLDEGTYKRITGDLEAKTPKFREIKRVEPVESVPTQCIQVDADDNLYLAGQSLILTHNTGKVHRWNPVRDKNEGFKEQRQQTIYSMLLEQYGYKVSAARLIYPVYGEVVKVNHVDEELRTRVIHDIEQADSLMDTYRDTNLFEYTPSHLCAWCPLAKLCPVATIKGGKCAIAYEKQPEADVLLEGIQVQ